MATSFAGPPYMGVKYAEDQPVTTMDCPDCGHDRTAVIDTSGSTDAQTVRRRRECRDCGFRFTTYERPAWDRPQVRKRDGSLEPYDRQKLRAGVTLATRKRPVDADAIAALLDEVEATVIGEGTTLVSAADLGAAVAARLRALDAIAYIRFVSVFRAFSDPEEFLAELDTVLDAAASATTPDEQPDTS